MTGLWDSFLQGFGEIIQIFHGFTGNYGWAIVLLTVAIRLLLWPLTQAQLASAKRMQELQPEIQKIQRRYKTRKDKKAQQQMNEEMMRLWRERKVNPAGGCLPLLVQLPFLWAIYGVLQHYEPLNGATFLWIPNLNRPDPFYLLAVAAAVLSYLQVRMTAGRAGAGPQQAMMLYVMPLFLGWITATLPAGLGLYLVVTTLFSIVQQAVVNSQMKGEATTEGGAS